MSALTFVLVVLAVAVLTTALAALLLSVYLGAAGLVIAVPLALVIAPLLGLLMEAHSRATAAVRVIENARLRHECLHCGYDLRPNLGDTGVPTCPECGKHGLPSRSANCRRCGDPLQGLPAVAAAPARCPERGAVDDLPGRHRAAYDQEA